MPLYEYRCAAGHLTDEYRSVEDRSRATVCRCGELAEKIVSRVGFAMPDISGYRSMQTGEWISSRSKHRDHLRQHNLIEVGDQRMPERKPIEVESPREDIMRAMEVLR